MEKPVERNSRVSYQQDNHNIKEADKTYNQSKDRQKVLLATHQVQN